MPPSAPSRSRRLVEARGINGSGPEDGLQARLEVFSKLMFWAFFTLLAFLAAMYRVYPALSPENNELIFVGAMLGLVTMAVIWRVFLVRRALEVETLYRIDIIYAVFIGLAFGGSAILAYNFRPAGYASLIYASFMVFTRTIVVPSSGRRTLVISTIVFVPVIAAGIALAYTTKQDLPGPAYVIGGVVFATVAILLATIGSKIIYGLRQAVRDAMQLGPYTLDREIGRGGMGTVYRAHHAMLRRPTALKLLHPELVGEENLDRFEKEVQGMSTLTHPNTVAVFDYGRNADGLLYYAMEYLDGIDLDKLVKSDGPQRPARVARILQQVAGALGEAHSKGLVHRDVKPANIILCERGGAPDVAKVVDFGLVTGIANPGDPTHAIMGTPAYLAPEAVTGGAVTGAADLYALGCVGFFLLTGKRVFEGVSPVTMALAHVTRTPPRPSDVVATPIPTGLEDIIMRCLEKAPSDRFATAGDLAAALAALPPMADWPDEQARAWWVRFHATQQHAHLVSNERTVTLAVDLTRAE